MITDIGKIHVKRLLSSQVQTFAEAVAFGVGTAAESLTDNRLDFEVDRSEVSLRIYDFINDKLIIKATIPSTYAGEVREIGLYSKARNIDAGAYSSKMIATFDSNFETWSTGGFVTTNTRIGSESLNLTPAASATSTSSDSASILDFSGYSGSDLFNLAFYSTNSNTSSVKLRFLSDASNYFEFSKSPSVGYNVASFTKSSASVTGSPNWADITSIAALVTATSGGSANVSFDGLRIEDVDTLTDSYYLVSRVVLASPFTKVAGSAKEIEVPIGVSI